MKYEGLPFPSKFFSWNESEDLGLIYPQIEIGLDHCPVEHEPLTSLKTNKEEDFTVIYPTLKVLDTNIALEAAYGDSRFLVN